MSSTAIASNFRGGIYKLDGAIYEDCTFEKCELVYAGGQLPLLMHNTFTNCTWRFEGAAARTLEFLAALESGGGNEIVDMFLQQVRAAKAAQL